LRCVCFSAYFGEMKLRPRGALRSAGIQDMNDSVKGFAHAASAGVIVRFNDPDEFISELAKGPATLDSILRVTVQYKATQMTPAIQHISVIAGALRKYDGVLQLIELTRYCGDYWGREFERRALDKADEVMKQLERRAPVFGLTIRAGAYELNGKESS
jgi:hypothetical protein